ncbi:hypothetical protein LO762_18160 [Actinocorallia sp. API 0066]|uniref:hypothetical protein n=1 Tax=Actinocorallia sp. API 0066 TaxID=2896846 RepID=UPI001E39677B|nr:hypothetical protein [Actinocorallia sp. API 0066]MCD0451107.1 hypothetical protein [Actinocorallia sp. API 0066]
MTVEDRLRAALRDTGDLVADRPRPLRHTPRQRARWQRLLPLWSALAAALVVLMPSALPDDTRDTDVRAAVPDIGAAPPFFVAVHRGQGAAPARFEVRATATGALLDTNAAGGGEDFLAVAPVPEDGDPDARTYLLLVRESTATAPGCATYGVRRIAISAGGRFTSWGTEPVAFEAADTGPHRLATTPKGDAIAYSYRSCRPGWVTSEGVEGPVGEARIAHRWKDTTTTWPSGGEVLGLAYTPDGRDLAVFRKEAEDGRGELLVVRTADPDDVTTPLARVGGDALHDRLAPARLSQAMITPDGARIICVFGEPWGSGTALSLVEAAGGSARPLGPPGSLRAEGPVLLAQHPKGTELLLQAGGRTIRHVDGTDTVIVPDGATPADIAW